MPLLYFFIRWVAAVGRIMTKEGAIVQTMREVMKRLTDVVGCLNGFDMKRLGFCKEMVQIVSSLIDHFD